MHVLDDERDLLGIEVGRRSTLALVLTNDAVENLQNLFSFSTFQSFSRGVLFLTSGNFLFGSLFHPMSELMTNGSAMGCSSES